MPYNAQGVFTRIYSWVTDATNGIVIDPTRMDKDSNDIAAGLSAAATKSALAAKTGASMIGTSSGKTLDQVLSSGTGNASSFDSLAALRLYSTKATAALSATVASFAGTNAATVQPAPFQGNYYVNLTDTTSADNGWSIIVDAAGNRWYLSPQPTYSMAQLGAINDGTTSSSAAFALAEASSIDGFYLPEGTYVTGLAAVSKRYFGPGQLILTGGNGVNGHPVEFQLPKQGGLTSGMSTAFIQGRTDIFLGDSITWGYGATTIPYMYMNQLQRYLNTRQSSGQGTFQNGGSLTQLAITQAGSITVGNNGPIQHSLILGVGASLTFSADYVDVVSAYFMRTPSAGTLTLTTSTPSPGTVLGSFSCAGAAAANVLGNFTTLAKGLPGQQFTITASGAAVEVTGITAYHSISGNSYASPVLLQMHANSGYSTADFALPSVCSSIIAQQMFPSSNFSRVIIALGTNDIYNATKAVSSAQYKANLLSIINQINVGTNFTFVLVIPYEASATWGAPIKEPFDNYRRAVLEVARIKGTDVMDLSAIDLVSIGGLDPDGLHPNNYGHSIIADAWYKKLYANMVFADRTGTVNLGTSITAATGGYSVPGVTMGTQSKFFWNGTITTGAAIAANSTIATVSTEFSPLTAKAFAVPCWVGTTATTMNVLINRAGIMTCINAIPSGANLSFDGICYSYT